jgi:GDP-4-dehydro-6-deoxy-D-mannose reductase
MRVLIVGVNGFVGYYLERELLDSGYEVEGADIKGTHKFVDLLKKDSLLSVIQEVDPEAIVHLAGQSSVARSWEDPQLTFDINVKGTLNLLDSVREIDRSIRVLIIGSSDEYGIVKPSDCPITEEHKLNPINPYAISKTTQEQIALTYLKAYDMDLVLTRSFNHTGPGQPRGFVIPDFASQVAAIERGAEPVIKVGNLKAKRDFSDVRDVAHAYRLLLEKGKTGEVYNIGSGKAYLVEALLHQLICFSDKKIQIEKDPDKFRPVELPVVQSSIEKLKLDTGFYPLFAIEETLKNTLDYWRHNKEI